MFVLAFGMLLCCRPCDRRYREVAPTLAWRRFGPSVSQYAIMISLLAAAIGVLITIDISYAAIGVRSLIIIGVLLVAASMGVVMMKALEEANKRGAQTDDTNAEQSGRRAEQSYGQSVGSNVDAIRASVVDATGQQMFAKFDRDGDGFLSRAEMKRLVINPPRDSPPQNRFWTQVYI